MVPVAVGGTVAALVIAGAVESGAGLAAVPRSQIVPASLRGDAQCVLRLLSVGRPITVGVSPARSLADASVTEVEAHDE